MFNHARNLLWLMLVALLLGSAQAQNYPTKPIRLVIGFPPGGAADILGRIAAQRLTDALGQQVVVDNRSGAGGSIAAEIAARSVPDGYTLYFTSLPHVINPHLYEKVNYDAIKDFAPVAQFVGDTPEQYTAFFKTEIEKWGKAVRVSGAKVD